MATGRRDDDQQMILHSEVQLTMLSAGSFRLRPCSYCGNSDPRFIELEEEEDQSRDGGAEGSEGGGGAGNGEAAAETARPMQRLKCKKCNNPYTLQSTSAAEDLPSPLLEGDGDDGSGLAGVECCKCGNAISDCFRVSRYDNGHLRSITCLICDHGNTFHEPDADASVGSTSNDASKSESSACAAIECIKCHNTDENLFDVTFHPDGRVHKVTCKVCKHGNTFHEPDADASVVSPSKDASESGSESSACAAIECIKCHNTDENLFDVTFHPDGRIHKVTCKVCKHGNTFRTQPEQAPATSWFSWNAVSNAAQVLATPVWSVGQSLVQKSLQVSNTIQNNGPLRDMAAGQVASLGKDLVLGLGDTYLRMLLPMIPDKTRQAVTRNLSEVISQWAIKLLAARKEKKDSTADSANTPADTKDLATEDKPPKDDDSSLGAI